jgi:hypothetical protein
MNGKNTGVDVIEKHRIGKTVEVYRKWCLKCRNDTLRFFLDK